MLRIFKYILLVFVVVINSNSAFTQVNLSKVRAGFAETLYSLKGNASSTWIDEMIKTYQSFGDTYIAVNMMMESFVIGDNEEVSTDINPIPSLYDYKLSKSDSLKLNNLPPINRDLYKLPSYLMLYSLFANVYCLQASFLKEYFDLKSLKSTLLPNIPKLEDNDNFELDFLKWTLNFPEESKYISDRYYASCSLWKKADCTNEDLLLFKENINTYVIDNSFYKVWLPDYAIKQSDNNDSSNLHFTNDQMRQNIEGFLKDAFSIILDREPSEQEIVRFSNYIEANQDVTPELVFLALLMIKNG